MQHGAVLRDVDPLATDHRVAAFDDSRRAGHGEEGDQHGVVDTLFGVVDAQVADTDEVALGATRVGGEEVAQVRWRGKRRERIPLRRGRDVDVVAEVHRRGP